MTNATRRKRALFVEADVKVLVAEVKKHFGTLTSKKEAGVTPAVKNATWKKITANYNAARGKHNGVKTMLELRTKTKNLRAMDKSLFADVNPKENKPNGRSHTEIEAVDVIDYSDMDTELDSDIKGDDIEDEIPYTVAHVTDINNFTGVEDVDSFTGHVDVAENITKNHVDEGVKLENKLKLMELRQKAEIHRLEVKRRNLEIESLELQIMQQRKDLEINDEFDD